MEDKFMPVYFYQDTIIAVRPGLGEDNWATCKLKPSGGWSTVKTNAMPRTNRFDEAINNFHDWAKSKKLRRADCGCCMFNATEHCTKHKVILEKRGGIRLRPSICDEMEGGHKIAN